MSFDQTAVTEPRLLAPVDSGADAVASGKRNALRDLATEWDDEACKQANKYKVDGILWKGMSYLLLLATAAGGAGGGAALAGYKYWAAGLAFLSAGAAAGASIASNEVSRQRVKKIHWRQFHRDAEAFLRVTLPNGTPKVVDAAFADLEASIKHAEAGDLGQ
jgi:hypothetical protein